MVWVKQAVPLDEAIIAAGRRNVNRFPGTFTISLQEVGNGPVYS